MREIIARITGSLSQGTFQEVRGTKIVSMNKER
jgi:hypothetical protein